MTVPKKFCKFCGVLISVKGRHISRGRCSVERGSSVRRGFRGT